MRPLASFSSIFLASRSCSLGFKSASNVVALNMAKVVHTARCQKGVVESKCYKFIISMVMCNGVSTVCCNFGIKTTRRRMARERRGAESSLVSMETPYYKTIYERCVIGSREEEYQDNIAQVQDSSLHRIFCKAFHTQNFLQRDAFTHRCF